MTEGEAIPVHLLIRMRRNRLGLTQPELARALGVSPRTVLRWENYGGTPDTANRQKLATILGGDPDDYAVAGEKPPEILRLESLIRKADRKIKDMERTYAASMAEDQPQLLRRLADLEALVRAMREEGP
jgi:transcriptional regulator with XRE-family HTH domain